VATNGDKVCAIFATGDMICADMEGQLVWAKNVGVPDVYYAHASSLLIYNNLVFIQWDHHKVKKVFAIDVNTGEERWNKIRNEKESSWSTPMIAFANNNPLLILTGNPGVTAYNPNTGDQLWRVECLSGEVAPSACSVEGVIFALNEYAKLVAINGSDGSIMWESKDILSAVPSPVATKDNLYVTTEYGLVVSYSAKTGEMRKEHDLEGGISASPILAEGKIYQIAENGKVCIFSADDEFKLLYTFETGEKTFATPAFTDGKIVIRTEKSIYCVTNGL
jgi:outer membrane protein assembly factor BamB